MIHKFQLPAFAGLLAALLSTTASAQLLSRGEHQLTDPNNTQGSPVQSAGFGHWRLATPDGNLPADPAKGLTATAQLVYAVFTDEDPTTSDTVLSVRTSTDGGLTWRPAQTIYTVDTLAGESLSTGGVETQILASHHNVAVIFATNRHDAAQSGQSAWVIGSSDQGQTWSAPVLLSAQSTPGAIDQFFDVDEIRAVLDRDLLHVCFEADYLANPSGSGTAGSGSEDLFYTQAQIGGAGAAVAVTVPNVRIDTAHAPGSVDVDCPQIDADGPIVTLAWLDDRNQVPDQFGVLTHQNDTFSRTSLAFGTDFGLASGPAETNHTNFSTLLSLAWAAPRCCDVAVVAPTVYVFMEDSRDSMSDAIYCDVSLDAGTTFQPTQRVSTNPPGEDVDGFVMAHDGDRFALFTKTDRHGSNAVNIGFVYSGDTMDLLNGTMSEASCSPAQDLVLYDVSVQGDVIAAVYESCPFPEEAYVAISSDGGASFDVRRLTDQGSCSGLAGNADVDDVRVAITANRDVVAVWADDRFGPGNVREDVWVSSTKVPTLLDHTNPNPPGVGGTMELVNLGPSDVGDWAFLMISAGGANSTTTLGPSLTGAFSPALVRDFWFDALLGDVTFVLEYVTADPATGAATARFDGLSPLGIPNLRLLLGQPFWAAAGTADTATLEFKYFTDTVAF